MSAGVDLFRRIACGLPGAAESAHMGNPDFRVGGRIFATLSGQARGRGVLKLTLEQQAAFVAELPEVFEPVQGGWGRMGMTYIVLDRADEGTMRGALVVAHKNVVSKQDFGIGEGESGEEAGSVIRRPCSGLQYEREYKPV